MTNDQQAYDRTPDLSRILKLAARAWDCRDLYCLRKATDALTPEDIQLLEAVLKE